MIQLIQMFKSLPNSSLTLESHVRKFSKVSHWFLKMNFFMLLLGKTDKDELELLLELYICFIQRVNVIQRDHLVIEKEVDEEVAGPSQKKVKTGEAGKGRKKKQPRVSCIPHPNTLSA